MDRLALSVSELNNRIKELIELEPDALGQAIGKEGRMATVVTDHGMAQRVLQLARL